MTPERRKYIYDRLQFESEIHEFLTTLEPSEIQAMAEGPLHRNETAAIIVFHRAGQREDLIETMKLLEVESHNIYDHIGQHGNSLLYLVTLYHTLINQSYEHPFIDYIASRVSNINAVTGSLEMTAAVSAVQSLDLHTLTALFKHGADPLIPDVSGKNCDDYALEKGNINPDFYRQYLALRNASTLAPFATGQRKLKL